MSLTLSHLFFIYIGRVPDLLYLVLDSDDCVLDFGYNNHVI